MKRFISSIIIISSLTCGIMGCSSSTVNSQNGSAPKSNSAQASRVENSVPKEENDNSLSSSRNETADSSEKSAESMENKSRESSVEQTEPASGKTNETVTDGTETYRGFTVDSVLHSENNGDIHYCVYIPTSYDGSEPYALFVTLPGYQGLYFQGVAQNIKTEEFGFETQKYNDKMIIAAPQLNDWHMTSAEETVALTKYFLNAYNIDKNRVFINGYSGGGETLSQVLELAPELYTAALMCSSQWDGNFENVAAAKTPVYFAIGENDEYYSSEPFKKAYSEIKKLYEAQGLSEEEINKLLVLDVKPNEYFTNGGATNQHGGGAYLFCRDEKIMKWLFDR